MVRQRVDWPIILEQADICLIKELIYFEPFILRHFIYVLTITSYKVQSCKVKLTSPLYTNESTKMQKVSEWFSQGPRAWSLNPAWFPLDSVSQRCPPKAWISRREEAAWSRGKNFSGICTHQLWGLGKSFFLSESQLSNLENKNVLPYFTELLWWSNGVTCKNTLCMLSVYGQCSM